MKNETFTSPIVGTVLKIEGGCFNDILTIKLGNQVVESRGFDIGLNGVPMFREGDKVVATLKWNDLSRCYYAIKLDLIGLKGVPIPMFKEGDNNSESF